MVHAISNGVLKKKDQKIEKQLKSSVMEKHSLFQTLQES